MILRAGQRLNSVVSDVQVVVVRAPANDVSIECGGVPMVEGADARDPSLPAAEGDGPQLGKRYADEDLGLELLCAKGGAGALSVGGAALLVKGAKPLPSSD